MTKKFPCPPVRNVHGHPARPSTPWPSTPEERAALTGWLEQWHWDQAQWQQEECAYLCRIIEVLHEQRCGRVMNVVGEIAAQAARGIWNSDELATRLLLAYLDLPDAPSGAVGDRMQLIRDELDRKAAP